MRCVEQKELTTRCLTSTRIEGQASVAGSDAPVPVAVEASHQQVVGVCGGLSRGTAISGRAAAIALADRLTELAAAR